MHQSHNSQRHHFVTEMCTHVHISVTKWCIVGCLWNALWDNCEIGLKRPTMEVVTRFSPNNKLFDRRSWALTVCMHNFNSRHMMTSWNGNIFRVTGHCAGNSPVPGEFPAQRPVTRSFDVFFICVWKNGWVNNRGTGDLRRHRAHYDVIVMSEWGESKHTNVFHFLLFLNAMMVQRR